jgi:hypothetical protein
MIIFTTSALCAGAQTVIFLSYRLIVAVALDTSLSTPETRPSTLFLVPFVLARNGPRTAKEKESKRLEKNNLSGRSKS